MALIPTVTKVMPTDNDARLKMVLTDSSLPADEQEVINKVYSQGYDPETGPTVEVRDKIEAEMQLDINSYKAKKAVYDSAGYTNAPAVIEGNLVV